MAKLINPFTSSQDILEQRRKERQTALQKLYTQNQAVRGNEANKAAADLGTTLGFLFGQKLGGGGTDPLLEQAKAKEQAAKSIFQISPYERTNATTPEGGIVQGKQTPRTQSQMQMELADRLGRYADLTGDSVAGTNAMLTRMKALELGKAEREAAKQQANQEKYFSGFSETEQAGLVAGVITPDQVIDNKVKQRELAMKAPTQVTRRVGDEQVTFEFVPGKGYKEVARGAAFAPPARTDINLPKDKLAPLKWMESTYKESIKTPEENLRTINNINQSLEGDTGLDAVVIRNGLAGLYGNSSRAMAEIAQFASLGGFGQSIADNFTRFVEGDYSPKSKREIKEFVNLTEQYELNKIAQAQELVNYQSEFFGTDPRLVGVDATGMKPEYMQYIPDAQ